MVSLLDRSEALQLACLIVSQTDARQKETYDQVQSIMQKLNNTAIALC